MGSMNVSIPDELLEKADSVIGERGYSSRSELVRDAIRSFLQELEWDSGVKGNVLGVIITTYDAERRGISDGTTRLQHRYEDVIMTTLHNHMGELCMELVITRGSAKRVKELTENLRAIRGMESAKASILRMP